MAALGNLAVWLHAQMLVERAFKASKLLDEVEGGILEAGKIAFAAGFLGEQGGRVMEEARVIELERLPPPLLSLSPPTPPPLQQQVEIERGQQAADGGVSVVIVAEKWINGGNDSGEEQDPQAAPQRRHS